MCNLCPSIPSEQTPPGPSWGLLNHRITEGVGKDPQEQPLAGPQPVPRVQGGDPTSALYIEPSQYSQCAFPVHSQLRQSAEPQTSPTKHPLPT